jgi:Sigma-70, region 4
VARHEAIRLARSDRPLVSMSALHPDGLPDAAVAPTRASDRCEALEALTLLAALPERKRTFLVAKVAGYSYDEIAAELDVSWLTVNRQLVRARACARRGAGVDAGQRLLPIDGPASLRTARYPICSHLRTGRRLLLPRRQAAAPGGSTALTAPTGSY